LSALQEATRIFTCARCGALVVICTQCDRGHIYCEGPCRGVRRDETNRKAAKKYQATHKGALNHAKRQKRHRHKKAKLKAAASPSQRDQDGGQGSGSRAPGEPPARHSPVPGLTRGMTAFSEPSGLDGSPSVSAAAPEPQIGNPGPVTALSGSCTGVATLVPAPTHQSSTDGQDCSPCLEGISVENRVSEKIVTHHGSPEDADGVRLGTLARAAGGFRAFARRSIEGSTSRKPGSVSRCHFCGRPASGFVRFGFLGSMEVP
jgi:hypothetical protein